MKTISMLTGKAKEDFDKWYHKLNETYFLDVMGVDFYQLPFSMQYGMYVDWLDSVDIEIRIEKGLVHSGSEVYYWNTFPSGGNINHTEKTLYEARRGSIKKAVEIYNKKP
jgi:cephalosporin hydroxylase